MLRTILEEVKAKGFKITPIVMDHDTKGGNVACCVFPEVTITYCGNHTVKSFHHDLMKIKSVRCKVKVKSVLTIITIAFNSAHHHARPELMMLSSTELKKLLETL